MRPSDVADFKLMDEAAERWAEDPVAFFEEVLEVEYIDPPCGIEGCTECKPHIRMILESVRDNRRTIVGACHDTAKTFLAGGVFWWWILSHAPAVVVTSSSTGRQVRRGMWKEIRAHWVRSRFLNQNFPEPNMEDWQYPGEPDWYGFGFSTNPDQAESGATRVQSQHSQNLLLIFDEAIAIDRLIWDAAKGSLTQLHNHWLVLANPTDPNSEFGNVWRTGAGWNRIEISAFDTPNLVHGDGTNPHLVTRQWVEEYIRDNGEDHPLVQARVYGRLPDASTTAFISYRDLLATYLREPAPEPVDGWLPVEIGVDVARFGDDLTTIYVIRGDAILHAEAYGGKDTVFTAQRVMRVAEDFGLTKAFARNISVDDTGVGGGVTDILRANDWKVNAEDFGSKPIDETTYWDRRTELWDYLRDWLRKEAALSTLTRDERRRLEADLPGVLYEVRAKGAQTLIKLESKKDIKKRLGHSPDHGDGLALALAGRTARRRFGPGKRKDSEKHMGVPEDDPRYRSYSEDRNSPQRKRKERRAGFYDRTPSGGIYG